RGGNGLRDRRSGTGAQRDDRGVRLSSDLPPAGFTRAEPRPPARPRRAFAVAAAVLGAGLALTAGYAAIAAAPGGTVTPAASSSAAPSSSPPVAPRPAPAPPATRAAPGPEEVPSASRAVKPDGPSRRAGSAPSRDSRPRGVRPRESRPRGFRPRTRASRPGPPSRPRAGRPDRPAAPSWIAAECRRRFPDDPRRRAVCAAVLTETFGR